jgi:cellulose synthase (UDP-forming)
VTPKGSSTRQSTYARGIFWSVAGMMVLTVAGLVINASPEWRIADAAVIPIVAFWALNNILVLFLTCMMTLQAPTRRDEERFEFDEPIWIFGAAGALSTGRVKDMSLSGVGITPGQERALTVQVGERIQIFVPEVGFLAGRVVRRTGGFLGVEFEHSRSMERDLLIRKLFTSGYDTTSVRVSTLSATVAMLKSIWSTRAELPSAVPKTASATTPGTPLPIMPSEKLPAISLVVLPRQPTESIAELVERRKELAA